MGESSVDNINGGEKSIQHYSSSHEILLVGQVDFSFSACLAKSFGTAANMIVLWAWIFGDEIYNEIIIKSNKDSLTL